MKFGISTSISEINKFSTAGYDYIEPSFSDIVKMSEIDFLEARKKVSESQIKCEVFNVAFPPDMFLVGPKVNFTLIENHLITGYNRIIKLGAKILVIGSGKSRQFNNINKNKAYTDLKKVIVLAGEKTQKLGIKIALEPLNREETNLINSTDEGLKMVQEIAYPQVKLLIDFYHMRKTGESISVILKCKDIVIHTHIARTNGRIHPINADEDSYDEFFKTLAAINYTGRMSIEAKPDNVEESEKKSLNLLRHFAKKYNM
jgi:D-psicose/D-tagatose/L-ribulose 3-epimerase